MESRLRRSWPAWVLFLYILQGIWLALHVRWMKAALADFFAQGDVPREARFTLVSYLRMLVEGMAGGWLAVAGMILAVALGKGPLRIFLVILGFALWAAYAWAPVYLMP